MRYANTAIADLRWVETECDARSIERIEGVSAVIYPRLVIQPVAVLLRQIPKSDIGIEVEMDDADQISIGSGRRTVVDADASAEHDTLLLINGKVILYPIARDKRLRLIINGSVIAHESLKDHPGIHFLCHNGARTYVSFQDDKRYEELTVTPDFLTYLKDETLIFAEEVRIRADVDAALLRQKIAQFRAESITCPENLHGLIQAISVAEEIRIR